MKTFVLSGFLLLFSVFIYGQGFTGPGSDGQSVMTGRFITVNEARNLPNDSWVILAGNIRFAIQQGISRLTSARKNGGDFL